MTGSTRIITNTLASYVRLTSLGLAGLLSTPLALRALGVTDYGIFAVVGGTMTLLLFVNVALISGAQRHISYALGEGKLEEVRKWLTASLTLHTIFATILAVVTLLASRWAVADVLEIPAGRLVAALWLYRMVIAAMVCNICAAPYQAFMAAHEEFLPLSLMSVFSSVALILGSFALKYLPGDLLIWYGGVYSFSQCVLFMGPVVYCWLRFTDSCRFEPEGLQRRYLTELLSFSGWSLFGAFSGLVKGQGPAILLARFFGPAANAAYGLAAQANGAASNVSSGVSRATTPQIVKRHAGGDSLGMASLSNASNLYAFGILWLAIAPVLFDTKYCLRVWLHKVPPNTAAFLDLLLIALLIDQLTMSFSASVQATGRIAGYQIVVGTMNCLTIPVGYVCLRMGLPGTSILVAGIGTTLLATIARMWFARVQTGIPVTNWLRSVLLPSSICVIGSLLASFVPIRFLPPGFTRFAAVLITSSTASGYILWRIGALPSHRERVKSLAVAVFKRRKNVEPRSA